MEPDGSGTRDSGTRTSIDVIISRKWPERLRVDRYGFGSKSGLGFVARVNSRYGATGAFAALGLVAYMAIVVG